MKIDDTVYIKSYEDKRKITTYKIIYLNNTHAIIATLNKKLHKKISLDLLTTRKEEAKSVENIKKGDLVKCILNDFTVEEGVVIESYKYFVLVLVGKKRRKMIKNKIIVLNT